MCLGCSLSLSLRPRHCWTAYFWLNDVEKAARMTVWIPVSGLQCCLWNEESFVWHHTKRNWPDHLYLFILFSSPQLSMLLKSLFKQKGAEWRRSWHCCNVIQSCWLLVDLQKIPHNFWAGVGAQAPPISNGKNFILCQFVYGKNNGTGFSRCWSMSYSIFLPWGGRGKGRQQHCRDSPGSGQGSTHQRRCKKDGRKVLEEARGFKKEQVIFFANMIIVNFVYTLPVTKMDFLLPMNPCWFLILIKWMQTICPFTIHINLYIYLSKSKCILIQLFFWWHSWGCLVWSRPRHCCSAVAVSGIAIAGILFIWGISVTCEGFIQLFYRFYTRHLTRLPAYM